jgi:hypothetical protein
VAVLAVLMPVAVVVIGVGEEVVAVVVVVVGERVAKVNQCWS